MEDAIVEIEIKEDKTIEELMDELQFVSAPIVVELKGQIFYPDEVKGRRLGRGEKLTFISLIAGG